MIGVGITLLIEKEWITKEAMQKIQEFVGGVSVPSDIGRIPLKIASGFKADHWITIYSIPAPFGILQWQYFVLACSKPSLSHSDINLADVFLIRFCQRVERIYGTSCITSTWAFKRSVS